MSSYSGFLINPLVLFHQIFFFLL